MDTTVRRAGPGDLDALAPLFDSYRAFYNGGPEPGPSRDFIAARLERADSVLLLAEDAGGALGFAQLYPMFSSVRAARVWVLNDLFVSPLARRRGVARGLLQAAEAVGRADGAIRLELETDADNRAAQALYRAMGWTPFDGT
ncbi:GNAT family N-acetyltransferase, partial [Lysobacter sp. A3-1-A15]